MKFHRLCCACWVKTTRRLFPLSLFGIVKVNLMRMKKRGVGRRGQSVPLTSRRQIKKVRTARLYNTQVAVFESCRGMGQRLWQYVASRCWYGYRVHGVRELAALPSPLRSRVRGVWVLLSKLFSNHSVQVFCSGKSMLFCVTTTAQRLAVLYHLWGSILVLRAAV